MKMGDFIYQLFADGGEPSSSRVLTYIITAFDLVILQEVMHHLLNMTDSVAIGLWLSALPFVIAALAGFAATPYAINRSSESLSDILSAIVSRGK